MKFIIIYSNDLSNTVAVAVSQSLLGLDCLFCIVQTTSDLYSIPSDNSLYTLLENMVSFTTIHITI